MQVTSMSPNLQVFILGPARSGTSITYYAMREIFGLPGDGESHVIPMFSRILHIFYTHQQSFRDAEMEVLAQRLDTADSADILSITSGHFMDLPFLRGVGWTKR